MRNFGPAEEHEELKRLAILICRAINGPHVDPHLLVAPGQAVKFLDGHVLDITSAQPAWVRYLAAAKAVFDDRRYQEEIDMLRFTDGDAV